MKIKIANELIIVNLLVAALVIVIFFLPSAILRIVLGLPFVLFFPGYALMAALYPRKGGIDGIERLALSLGMSIAVVPLVGLALNYTPWGIRLTPILVSLTAVIFGLSVVAWVRRRRLLEGERFGIEFDVKLPGWGGTRLDKALSAVLVLAILGAMGTLGYVTAKPKVDEKFTEFYILGASGKAEGYPRDLVRGEPGEVIAGIINQEHETVVYRVEISVDGRKVGDVGPVTLGHDEKWEKEVGFVPASTGQNQKVEFLLYRDTRPEPYRKLHLWIDVKEESNIKNQNSK